VCVCVCVCVCVEVPVIMGSLEVQAHPRALTPSDDPTSGEPNRTGTSPTSYNNLLLRPVQLGASTATTAQDTHTPTLTQRSRQRSRHVISTSRSFFDFGFAAAMH